MDTIINSNGSGIPKQKLIEIKNKISTAPNHLREKFAKLRKYKGEKARRTEKVKFLDKLKENGQPVDDTTRELT